MGFTSFITCRTGAQSFGAVQPRIVIASADSDMCALLHGGGEGDSGGVAWLELLQRPEPSCPAGWRLQSAAQFAVAQGYPAAARPEYVALTGTARSGRRGGMAFECGASRLLKGGSAAVMRAWLLRWGQWR